ncbi:phage tail protein [Escherichia albertii]|uniref:phage tail protein n=2 Tax=Escherichia albertii TaxID=208962 RepID=UPI000F686D14|nr:phage tail protein [Escherichia albertii]
MSTTTRKFKTVITDTGAKKLAQAAAPDGKPVRLTHMAVGDGGGTLPTPDSKQTRLVHEVWRHTVNRVFLDATHQNRIIAELVIPPETGGFWIREIGVFDEHGDLIAVGNTAESYKPTVAEGSGRAQTFRTILTVSSTATVALTVDNTMVMATVDYVDDKLKEHEQSRRHPDASLTAKGFTQLSSATNSTSEALAATPKAVKAAYDLANGKYTAQDATTARKGLVQLSSATNSPSETLAATSKAVKAVMDETNKKAPLNSPALTGTPTTPTAPKGTNNTQIANTAFVMAAIAALVDSSPDALNTLNELAAALGNDPNFATTMTNALAGKQPKDATLTALAGLATAADRFPYFTGNDTASLATLTKVGRDILAKATVAAVIEYLGLQETVNQASGALQKNKNGDDIPDKERFLSNINVYSKGEVDKKRGMKKYEFSAPNNAVSGKWYPVVFRRESGFVGELASRIVISTKSGSGDYAMNNCEFNGTVMPGGWTDRSTYAVGFFSIYTPDERSIHSILSSTKSDDVCSVFYIEARAFPIQVFAEEGLTVIVPTEDYTIGQTTYKWGATNPATESTNAQAILDFKNGRGYYCSHPFISSLSGNAATATKLETPKKIAGVNFDGSEDIAISASNVGALPANIVGTIRNGQTMASANKPGWWQIGVADTSTVPDFPRYPNGTRLYGYGYMFVEVVGGTWFQHFYGHHGANAKRQNWSSGPTTDRGWVIDYNTSYKPSASDTSAYSKSESDARYITDIQYGAGTSVTTWKASGKWPNRAGYSITSVFKDAVDSNIDGVVYAPLQKRVNNTWYTVAGGTA